MFVCENNFYSVYSNLKVRQAAGRNISKLVQSHGVKAYKGNGNDINQVLAKIPQSPTKASAVLFNSSSYDFAVNLFALAHKGWTIILPPNGQSETLNALLEQTPYYLGDSDLVEHATTPFENIGNLTTTPNYTPFNKIAWPSEGNLLALQVKLSLFLNRGECLIKR